jgi:hypothetical protein
MKRNIDNVSTSADDAGSIIRALVSAENLFRGKNSQGMTNAEAEGYLL